MNSLAQQRILVTGVNGQVGRTLRQQLQGKCELITSTRNGEGADIAIDLSDLDNLEETIVELKPTIVINPAAYTQVDKAEDEPELAFTINGDAPEKIAEACKKLDALLIHYSTDYVFNGKSTIPYKEDDPTDPINVYGASKLAGERAIQEVDCKYLIFRTCWVYDSQGSNFLLTMLRLMKEHKELSVIDDQLGSPTWSKSIAEVSVDVISQIFDQKLLDEFKSGIINVSSAGFTSWHGFASKILELAQNKVESNAFSVEKINQISAENYPAPAKRPSYSVLAGDELKGRWGISLLDWDQSLIECIDEAL